MAVIGSIPISSTISGGIMYTLGSVLIIGTMCFLIGGFVGGITVFFGPSGVDKHSRLT